MCRLRKTFFFNWLPVFEIQEDFTEKSEFLASPDKMGLAGNIGSFPGKNAVGSPISTGVCRLLCISVLPA